MSASNWNRFGKLFLAVMGHSRLSPAEKVVHACLAMHGPHKVRQQLLADETGMSLRNLQRCIKVLKEEELIQVLPGKGKALAYRLLTPDSAVTPANDRDDGTPTTPPSPNLRHGRRVDQKRTIKE
jgi:hypothetical protein